MTSADVFRLVVAQSWQLAVMIGLITISLRLFARDRAHLAHALWLAVFVKALCPPFWSSPLGLFSWMQSPQRIAEAGPQLAPDRTPGVRVIRGNVFPIESRE